MALACPVQPANPAAAPISPFPAGTTPPLARFPRMRIREENCNMVLLAVVTLFAVAVAGGATLVGPTDNKRPGSPIEQPAAPRNRHPPTSESSPSATSRRCA